MPFDSPQANIPMGPPPDIRIFNAIQVALNNAGVGGSGGSGTFTGTVNLLNTTTGLHNPITSSGADGAQQIDIADGV